MAECLRHRLRDVPGPDGRPGALPGAQQFDELDAEFGFALTWCFDGVAAFIVRRTAG
ncbi:MAG: hypothetical protein JWR66_1654 [Modestobacter sp.]|nr:hypothetical protein [Modestobacter sp.]